MTKKEGMATVSASEGIKTDVRELADIAIEDTISKDSIIQYSQFYEIHRKEVLKKKLEHDLMVLDITGIHGISHRFVEKLLSVLSKYDKNEERRLIFECVVLMTKQVIDRQAIISQRTHRVD